MHSVPMSDARDPQTRDAPVCRPLSCAESPVGPRSAISCPAPCSLYACPIPDVPQPPAPPLPSPLPLF
eukprot:scaffold287299_cov23-Tisochrysis_lutea.AAC.1